MIVSARVGVFVEVVHWTGPRLSMLHPVDPLRQ